MFSGATVALYHLGLSIPRTVRDVAKAEGVGWMSSMQGRMGAVGVVPPFTKSLCLPWILF